MSRADRYEYSDWNKFGERVERARTQICMSRENFAELINRSINYVSDLEKGRTSCSVHTLYQISKVLKVTTDSLLYGGNSKYQDTNKEILHNIVDRCDTEEALILKDIIIATFHHLDKIKEKRQDK